MRRGLELVRVEDAKRLAGARYLEHQGHLEPRPLEIRHPNPVDAARQAHAAGPLLGLMQPVVIDEKLVVEIDPGAVVGSQYESVQAGLVDPESARVVGP